MRIEKKKVARNNPLSPAAKSAIAGLLGMAAAISLGACENGSSADSEEEPLGGDVYIPTNDQKDNPSSSETPQTSSSSQIVDIPLSHEPLSSSVVEALSSVAQTASSSSIKTASSSAEKPSQKYSSSYVSSGVSSAMHPIRSSSSATISSSSAADSSTSVSTPQSSSSQAESSVPSSSEAQTSSSSEAPISSSQVSSNSVESNSSSSITQPQSSSSSLNLPFSTNCTTDSTGLRVIMCHDEHGGMMGSMVSTYDMSEII